jgi:hypothetical protein
MSHTSQNIRSLFIKEIKQSPIDMIKSVYDYFVFLKQKVYSENSPSQVMEKEDAYNILSEKKFAEIWDNDEDAIYDKFAK